MPGPLPLKELKSRAAKAKKDLAAAGKAVTAGRKAMLELPNDRDTSATYRAAVADDISAARYLKEINERVESREAA